MDFLNQVLGSVASEAGSEAPVDIGYLIIKHVTNSQPWAFGWSKFVFMMAIAALFVVIGIMRAAKGYDENGVPKTRWSQMIDPFVEHFYRDIALPHVGKKWASKVAPLLLTFFFFVLTCNLLGLVPVAEVIHVGNHFAGNEMGHGKDDPAWIAPEGANALQSGLASISGFTKGGATATASFNVTASLAVISFFAIMLFGIMQHGVVGHFAHLAPKGVPFPVRWFLLLPIETLSMFVKPFALTMRLAANMTAGHMGILALMMGFIYAAQTASLAGSVGGFPAAILATGIMMLEIIVSFVQAYVFALLSGVFIGMAVQHH